MMGLEAVPFSCRCPTPLSSTVIFMTGSASYDYDMSPYRTNDISLVDWKTIFDPNIKNPLFISHIGFLLS